MSRVGSSPVPIPSGTEVEIGNGVLVAKGKLGRLEHPLARGIKAELNDGYVRLTVPSGSEDDKHLRALWGTTRALVNNVLIGVSEGFAKTLVLEGVGFRARVDGKVLRMSLGFSHEVVVPIPDHIKVEVQGDRRPSVRISGSLKQQVGQFAADLRRYRPPEPYKGKGLRYEGESILRKETKKK